MARWNPWTGAPTAELLDTAEQWLSAGRVLASVDEPLIQRLAPDALVVEVGPGLGTDLWALSFAVPSGQVVVVEQCPEVLARLSRWYAARPNLRFVRGSGLDGLDLASGRVDYLRLQRVAPYFSDAELGRFLARADTLLKPQGRLFLTAYHPCATPDADMACGLGFGHHTAAQLLQLARWHCRLRLERLELSVKDRLTRTQQHSGVLALDEAAADSLDERIREQVSGLGLASPDDEAEVEMRLFFQKDAGAPPEA